jgi:flagellar assembly factor FliW
MLLETRQFGAVEITDEDIIRFPKGILGFEDLERYVIIDHADSEPFRWLQCVDTPDLAFVVVNPVIFFPEYRVEVHAKEVADIGVENPHDVEILVIVTIPPQIEQMAANLQGPILINAGNRIAKQLVLTNSEYTVQHSITEQLSHIQKMKEHRPAVVVELTR